MTYATSTDLEEYFGSEYLLIATDRDGDDVADANVISAGLTAADEEIDSYLGVRYDLPLAAAPGILTRVACDLAMYHMSIGHTSMTEDKETRYKHRIKWLEKLSKGLVSLGPEEEQVVVQDEAAVASASSTDAETRQMTRTKLGSLM